MGELTEKQKNSPLYKYYVRDIAPAPADIVERVKNRDFGDAECVPIWDINCMFEDGYQKDEFGIFLHPEGGMEVSNLTDMPNVTPEMLDFWFAWHGLDSFRYMIWDKDDHFYCQTQDPEISLNENLSMKERYWNTTHMVEEVIVPGAEARRFPIHFVPPWEVGFDKAKWEKFTGTIISTNGTMIHFLRQKPEGGYELRTRFYMGWSFDGEKYTYDQNRPVIWELAEGLLLHNVKEYRHLAEILPEVYAEFKDNFRVDLD
ncbi:MAG: phloretin hydrolase [Parasporobacterium sp.]|nr:phloretin hydrolase [Parasporobacterium sp.]